MENKKNQLLLGFIICIIGFSTIFFNTSRLKVNLADLLLLGIGAACLLLYMTKKKSWSLIVGSYLFYFGAYRLLSILLGGRLSGNIFAAMFFIVPGLIFFVLYYDKNKYGLVVPASLLLWFGLYIFVMGVPLFSGIGVPSFFIFMGMGFMTTRVVSRGSVEKWAVYTALTLFCIGVLTLLGAIQTFAGTYFRPLISVAIIIFGLVVILKSVKKNTRNQ